MLLIEVDVSQGGGQMVITGELDLTTRPVLAERLSVVLRTRPRRLVLDLAGAGFMDCGSARLIASAGRFLPRWRTPDHPAPEPGGPACSRADRIRRRL